MAYIIKALNLEAGLGGNRKDWPDHVQVTAVELEPKIATVYQRLYPKDTVIVGDAGAYLLEHFEEFDFIWTSPPCQTRSKMNRATRHKSCRRYVDMTVYQRVIFLRTHFKGRWVVENVVPYFEELIAPSVRMGRHHFWTNFAVTPIEVPTPPDFINLCNLKGKAVLMDWLGIHYPENIYYGTNHCPAQILRNCVHPVMGAHVLNAARNGENTLALTG